MSGSPPNEAAAPNEADSSVPTGDVQDTGEVLESSTGDDDGVERPPVAPFPPRPNLPRNAMQAASQAQTTAADAVAQSEAPTDSLSLAQLRRIVTEVNRVEPVAYDFVYDDMGSRAEELDEWFVYQFWQWVRLNAAQKVFEWHWTHEAGEQRNWDDSDHDTRSKFVQAAIAGIQSNDAALRSASIGKLVYLVLGRWGDTAMPNATVGEARSIASLPQLQAIKAGVECLASLGGIPVVWEALRNAFDLQWTGDTQQHTAQETQDELMNLMTIMYVTVQETLNDTEDMALSYEKLLNLQPSLVDHMLVVTSKLRWDEQNVMPQTQMLLLFWKSILLVFGNSKDLARIKKATSELNSANQEKEAITASPLDYHTFRQEITSKYPAYVPPRPAIPLEDENTSLLPPLGHQSNRNQGSNGILPAPPNAQSSGASILHQPVHIATPAPSPPPSPGVGGKGGKKQNYQTNQNFPFMYPPLDATSNSAGGKGIAALHDPAVSRRWEGSDIPASILEAGELFSARVRMTRATRQLWDERERFLKSERGWDEDDANDDVDDLDLSELTLEEREVLKQFKAEGTTKEPTPLPIEERVDFGPRPDELSNRDKRRLLAVEHFYHEALPHLQSLVIVLLRPIFVNVTALVAQQGNQAPNLPPRPNGSGLNLNGGPAGPRGPDSAQNGSTEAPEMSPEEVDAARTREITSKAMSGILLMLLKWLRMSHVLKFEYFTQLLLDSNYLPLVLKLFAHQDVQQVVDSKIDRVENSFFQFCNLRSKFKDQEDSDNDGEDDVQDHNEAGQSDKNQQTAEESDDDAAPPPIKRQRSPPPPPVNDPESRDRRDDDSPDEGQGSGRPEVDELGCPVNNHPTEPITDFSWRNFFSLINCLRVMQKICKNKSHRNLLLVQYKSSTILRKSLRIPQPELRLYTLKLFKNQVPYCGRKWRQGNMRVITAVYLYCRPELRDEWLAGSDIDAEVDSALPLEQALRGLTHWLNVRRYPDKVAAAEVREATKVENDFFSRELERLNMDWADLAVADDGVSEADPNDAWSWPVRDA